MHTLTPVRCELAARLRSHTLPSAILPLVVPRLQTVFEKFADYRFKRIVVVDEEARCKGIISVSDLLAYFL